MPKGEKIRPKQEMDRLPLENFETSRVRVFVCQNTLVETSRVRVFVCQNTLVETSRVKVFVCQNTLVCLLLSKVGLLWGEGLIMGKRGSF
jgi:intracellular sulfur oxidation DsrE/DsrF family protein